MCCAGAAFIIVPVLPRVYPIVDTATLASCGMDPVEFAAALVDGGARWLQFRCDIMTGFVRQVREVMDRTARGGRGISAACVRW